MRFLNILTIGFLAIALSACSGDDFVEAVEPTTTIAGIASDDPLDGATVEVFDLSGALIDSTTTNADGYFSLDVNNASITDGYELVASGGQLHGESFVGEMMAAYSSSDDSANANVTPITTLVSEIGARYSSGGMIERRDNALATLTSIGLLAESDWNAIEPSGVDMEAIRDVIARSGLEAVIGVFAEDLADDAVSPTNMAYFPSAHGGILSVSIGGNNQIDGFAGSGGEQVLKVSIVDPAMSVSAEKIDGPDWVSVDESGVVSYSIPADADVSSETLIQLEVENTETGFGRALTVSLFALAGDIIAEGTIDSTGGTISDSLGHVSANFAEESVIAPASVAIRLGPDRGGNLVVGIMVDGVLLKPYSLYLPPTELLRANYGASSAAQTKPAQSSAKAGETARSVAAKPLVNENGKDCEQTEENYILSQCWETFDAYFFRESRLPSNTGPVQSWLDVHARNMVSSQLQSNITLEQAENLRAAGEMHDPVLFIHGYSLRDVIAYLPLGEEEPYTFGGEEGTWGAFPEFLSDSHQPFEFRWRTNARFQDVADDLGSAIETVARITGKDVHIVAHSFGGILTRTLIQGLASSGSDVSDLVASVTTIGTPHSGIFDRVTVRQGVSFPGGQDSVQFEGCGQLSCYQMGEELVDFSLKGLLFDLRATAGWVAASLAGTASNPWPTSIPLQVLIGMTTDNGRDSVADSGDGLISYEGQRLYPHLTVNQENGEVEYDSLIREESTTYRCEQGITETVLGFVDENVTPGSRPTALDSDYDAGYRHSNSFAEFRGDAAEVDIDCLFESTCEHDGWLKTSSFLASCTSQTSGSSLFPVTVTVTGPDGIGVNLALVQFYVNGRRVSLNGNAFSDEGGVVTGQLPFFSNSRYQATATPISEPELRSAAAADYLYTAEVIPANTVEFPEIRLVAASAERGTLSGSIHDVETGLPIQGAWFSVSNTLAPTISGTAASGTYVVEGLAPGLYKVSATAPEYPTVEIVDCYVGEALNTCDIGLVWVEGADTVPPASPENLEVVAASPTQVNLTWDSSQDDGDFSHYSVYRFGAPIAEGLTTTQFIDIGLWPESDYCYFVTAFDLAGNGASTAEQCAQTTSELTPAGLSAAVGNGEVTLSWNPVAGASSYNVYWSESPDVTMDDTPITDVDSPHTHTALINDNLYYYVVTAVVGGVESPPSAEVIAIPRNATSAAFNQVFFATERDGNWEIYAAEFPPGTAQQNLTQNAADDQLVVVSPLLNMVAFVSDRDGNSEVYKMNIDGSEQTPLTADAGEDAPMPWSFDGSEILFVTDRNGNYDIYKTDASGAITTQLTSSEGDDTLASWSPDAQQITFATDRDGNKEVYRMSAAGLDMINLTNHSAIDDIPFYSPSGRKIAFVSDRDGDFDLFTMNPDGSGLFKLTGELVDDVGWFAWSPDGSRIAYDSAVDGDYEVYVINSNGTDQRQLTDNTAKDQYASWTADGSGILYVSDIDGNHEIYLALLDGSEPVNITNDPSDDWIPVFSPIYGTQNCFIATAAYGSYLDPHVRILRDFRDAHLLTNAPGKAFVNFYYEVSPPVAALIARHESLRTITRVALTPVVFGVKYPLAGGLMIVLIVALPVMWWRNRRRRISVATQAGLNVNSAGSVA